MHPACYFRPLPSHPFNHPPAHPPHYPSNQASSSLPSFSCCGLDLRTQEDYDAHRGFKHNLMVAIMDDNGTGIVLSRAYVEDQYKCVCGLVAGRSPIVVKSHAEHECPELATKGTGRVYFQKEEGGPVWITAPTVRGTSGRQEEFEIGHGIPRFRGLPYAGSERRKQEKSEVDEGFIDRPPPLHLYARPVHLPPPPPLNPLNPFYGPQTETQSQLPSQPQPSSSPSLAYGIPPSSPTRERARPARAANDPSGTRPPPLDPSPVSDLTSVQPGGRTEKKKSTKKKPVKMQVPFPSQEGGGGTGGQGGGVGGGAQRRESTGRGWESEGGGSHASTSSFYPTSTPQRPSSSLSQTHHQHQQHQPRRHASSSTPTSLTPGSGPSSSPQTLPSMMSLATSLTNHSTHQGSLEASHRPPRHQTSLPNFSSPLSRPDDDSRHRPSLPTPPIFNPSRPLMPTRHSAPHLVPLPPLPPPLRFSSPEKVDVGREEHPTWEARDLDEQGSLGLTSGEGSRGRTRTEEGVDLLLGLSQIVVGLGEDEERDEVEGDEERDELEDDDGLEETRVERRDSGLGVQLDGRVGGVGEGSSLDRGRRIEGSPNVLRRESSSSSSGSYHQQPPHQLPPRPQHYPSCLRPALEPHDYPASHAPRSVERLPPTPSPRPLDYHPPPPTFTPSHEPATLFEVPRFSSSSTSLAATSTPERTDRKVSSKHKVTPPEKKDAKKNKEE